LHDVRAEDPAKRGVEQVRRRVVPLRVVAGRLRDDGPHRDRTLDGGEVALDVPDDRDPAADATSVIDLQTPPVAHDLAPVADLAAGLGIERVLPELEREPPVRATDRDDVRLDLDPLVADERLLRRRLELVPPLGELVGRDLVPRGSPVPARPLALRLERGLVALRVD